MKDPIVEAIRNSNLTQEEIREIQGELAAKEYTEFIAECRREGKSMEECAEEWKTKQGKKGEQAEAYGKPKKAYPKAYGTSFIEAILETLERAGISLSTEDQKKLRTLSSGESFSDTEQMVPVHGQSGNIIGFKVLRTGEQLDYQSVLPQEKEDRSEQYQKDLDETVDFVMHRGRFSNIGHQKEFRETRIRMGREKPKKEEEEED